MDVVHGFQLFQKSDIISLMPQNTEQFDGFFNADNVVQGQESSLWVSRSLATGCLIFFYLLSSNFDTAQFTRPTKRHSEAEPAELLASMKHASTKK